jgi:hypothetical protein
MRCRIEYGQPDSPRLCDGHEENDQDQQSRKRFPEWAVTATPHRLPRHPPDCRDQLLDLVPLVCHIARRKSIRDTMRDMIAEDILLHLMQRGAHRIDLGQDIHAIPVVFDHSQQAANLTLDALEAPGDLSLRNIVHGGRSLIQYP